MPTIERVTEDTAIDPDLLAIEPKCCWCSAKLILDEKRIAWCSGSQVCRDRQLSCAITKGDDPETREYLFVPTPKQTEIMESYAPNLFIWGNRGGGKSVAIRWFCHALACAIPG